MTSPEHDAEHAKSVLIYAPVGRDAALTRDLLVRAAISCAVCHSVADLCMTFDTQGGGAILLTEEALDDPAFPDFAATLERQPAWSDVPVLLFAGSSHGGSMSLRAIRSIETLRNVTFLERPIRLAAALSTVRAALRSRARQYELLDLLVELRRARTEAESANRLKDEFLATLSHELRTPLNAILGWTSMLTRGEIEASRMPRVFQTLERNAQAQAQLIADVLDVSRFITGKLQLQLTGVDLREVVLRALEGVRPAAAAKGIDLALRGETACTIRGDADRLQQIFWNLLSNAVKFTPAGGRVDVDIGRHDNRIDVAVADTGVGIPPAFLPYVFDRFRQLDQTSTRVHGGLGLGLSIVKHLTELHGGVVSVASAGEGRGACFRVALPANPPADDAGREAATEPAPSLAGRSILVVDDDESTREIVAAVLQQAQAQVTLTDSAAAGWTAVQRRMPDLIIADIGMPVEDGFSFIHRVREAAADTNAVPAIALSAYADAPSQGAALAAGFTAFLAKPARPQELVRLVGSLLGESPPVRPG